MCKYCDCKINDGIADRGEMIADSGYEGCYMKLDDFDDEYRIEVLGEGRNQSHPIEYCPMCGRNLKENEE